MLYSKDGVKLTTMCETGDWIWCIRSRPKHDYVVVGCNDGSISMLQLLFSTVWISSALFFLATAEAWPVVFVAIAMWSFMASMFVLYWTERLGTAWDARWRGWERGWHDGKTRFMDYTWSATRFGMPWLTLSSNILSLRKRYMPLTIGANWMWSGHLCYENCSPVLQLCIYILTLTSESSGANKVRGLYKKNSSLPGACGGSTLQPHYRLWVEQGGHWG